jgi:hypothetical protein
VTEALAALCFTVGGGLAGQIVRHQENRGPLPPRCGGHECRVHVGTDSLGHVHAADPLGATAEQFLVVQF